MIYRYSSYPFHWQQRNTGTRSISEWLHDQGNRRAWPIEGPSHPSVRCDPDVHSHQNPRRKHASASPVPAIKHATQWSSVKKRCTVRFLFFSRSALHNSLYNICGLKESAKDMFRLETITSHPFNTNTSYVSKVWTFRAILLLVPCPFWTITFKQSSKFN